MKKQIFLATLFLIASIFTVQVLSEEIETEISIISTGYITYRDYDIKVLNATNKTVTLEIKRGATNSSHNLTVGNLTDFPNFGFAIKITNVTTLANQLIANSLMGPDIKAREILLRPLKAYMATTHFALSAENRTFKIIAAYSENTTGLFKLIPDARCTIVFDDDLLKLNMTFVPDSGYEYSRAVLENSINYNASCSHTKFTHENQTMQIEIKSEVTEVVLIEPTGTVTSRDVSFVCEVRGQKPEKINLYSDTSGEWKSSGTGSVVGPNSPFRVTFIEKDVADGDYKWNCEALIGSNKPRAQNDGRFTVKYSSPNVNCTASIDCTAWQPDICPSRGKFTRICNNTNVCNYDTEESCTLGVVTSVIPSPSVDIVISSPAPTGGPKPPKGNMDMIYIIIIAVVAVAAILVIFILKRRNSGESLEDLGKDDYRGDEFGEEPGGGFGEGGGDEGRGEGGF